MVSWKKRGVREGVFKKCMLTCRASCMRFNLGHQSTTQNRTKQQPVFLVRSGASFHPRNFRPSILRLAGFITLLGPNVLELKSFAYTANRGDINYYRPA
jgi:hypothetical protein